MLFIKYFTAFVHVIRTGKASTLFYPYLARWTVTTPTYRTFKECLF